MKKNQIKKQTGHMVQSLMIEARANAYLISQGQCWLCGGFLDPACDSHGLRYDYWCTTLDCTTSLHFDEDGDFWWADESPENYGEASK